jgi:hypothetical protein
VKRKTYLVGAVGLVLIITGGVFTYTFTTAVQRIGIAEPTGDVSAVYIAVPQPDWDSVTDNLSANTTCGEVPAGNLFTIVPNTAYSGDMRVGVYLANTGSLLKAYQYLNAKVYMGGSGESGETPSYQLVTLQNGQAFFTLENLVSSVDNWTQTSQADFEGGTLNQIDTTTSPGDVLLDIYSDNVSDNFTDQTKIASSANVTIGGGQVILTSNTATETLRPNAAGDVTSISAQFPASGAHWNKVDEATADNYTTYVSTNSTNYQRDLYNILDHSTGSGLINSVTIHFRFAGDKEVYAIPYGAVGDLGYLKTIEIASSGDITDTVIDTLEFDAVKSKNPDIIHISGDVYAIAYAGDGDDGYLKTVEIAPSGDVTDTVIDTLEFDILKGKTPDIIPISGDVYAIAYAGNGDDGFLKTVEIATNGQITDTVIDTLEFDTVKGKTPHIVPVSGDVYAIAYAGNGDDGFLKTVEIATNGQITNTVIDTLEFATVLGRTPHIIPISGDVYAIAYEGEGNDGFLQTVEIATNGQITDTAIDTLEFDTLDGVSPNLIPISGDVYAIAYEGVLEDGFLKTVEIAASGNITDTVIDTLEFDTLQGMFPRIIKLPGDNNNYAIAYQGNGDDGFLKTVEIATNGQITDTVIDTLEFDTVQGKTPDIINLAGIVYARAAIKTNGTVYTGSEESIIGDTFVSKSYQWTTNPNTSSAWTWSEIDALQIGADLKTFYDHDDVELTQVYIEVNYTAYDSPGEIISINLLAGEIVVSTDNFTYNASVIPSGTGLRVQFSTDNTTWYNSSGASGGWDTLSQGINTIDLSGLGWSGPNFYYRMEFTSDGTATPVLDEIAVIFATYFTSGDLTSSDFDTGLGVYWYNIFFTIAEPSGTDIKFQIRTAATQGGLSSATWYGPTGTGDYYTTSGGAINTVHDGDRWVQYKAYFTGPSNKTPTFRDIIITFATSSDSYTIEIIGGGYCLVSDNTSEWGAGWTTTPEFYSEVVQR